MNDIARMRQLADSSGSDPRVISQYLHNAADELKLRRLEIEQLREALLPFAASAPRYEKCREDRPLVYCWNEDEKLTVGDLRRAAAAVT